MKRKRYSVEQITAALQQHEAGLTLRAKRPRRHVSAAHRQPVRHLPTQPNQVWSMDFVADQLHGGTRFRALTVIDVFTRECLAIRVGQKLGGEDVIQALTTISTQRGVPNVFIVTTAASFKVGWWICGRIKTGSALSFPGRGSPRTMPTLNRLTGAFGMNV